MTTNSVDEVVVVAGCLAIHKGVVVHVMHALA